MGRCSPGDAPRRAARGPPVDRVERDADCERRRLDERAGRVRDPERENELVELREEQRGDRGRDEVAATAEQRGAAEHDRRDGRQEVVVALVGRGLVDDAGVHDCREAVEDLRPDVGAGLWRFTRSPAVRAAISFAPTPSKRRPIGVSLTTAATTAVTPTAKYTGAGIPSQSPPPDPRQAGGRRRRDPRRVPEHGPEEQRVRPERRDDRVEAHPADQEPVQQAGDDRCEERYADRGPEPGVVPRRVLGHDHDVERQAARHREVDPALHDDERLTERRNRERRGERQHRQDDASVQARRCEQPARGEEGNRRSDDSGKAA